MAEDKVAQEIIAEWGRLDSDAATTMSNYQSVADHFFRRENAITTTRTPGEDKTLPVIDPTGAIDLANMVSGMVAIIVPNGQFFFRLGSSDWRLSGQENVRATLNTCTEIMHSEMFKAGFVEQLAEWMYSQIGFGTGNLFAGWDKLEGNLMFKDWDVSNFRFTVDYKGRPNGCLIKWQYTAQQAYDKFKEQAGPDVIKAATDPKKQNDKFTFIWRCKQRQNRDTTKTDNRNYRFEEICVNEKEKIQVSEDGYQRFPYHICRWMLSSQSVWGEGQGTVALSADKDLQAQKRAYQLSVDMHNTPPYEYLANNVEGLPRIWPKAANPVMELNSIKAIDGRLSGDTARTIELIQDTRGIIHQCFFKRIFDALSDVTKRLTQLEIFELIKSGRQQLILPATRIYNEGLTPLLIDVFHFLLENGKFPPLPPELTTLKIDYLGALALALQEQQSDALQRFAQFSVMMEPVIPGFTKRTINVERAGRRMGTTFGMAESDFNTAEEQAAILQQEQQEKQAAQMAMAAATASKSYKDSKDAPQPGSPAESVMAGMGAK
jgi:hypothetical protein